MPPFLRIPGGQTVAPEIEVLVKGIAPIPDVVHPLLAVGGADNVVWYIDGERTIADVCDELCESIGAWWSFNRAGLLTIGQLSTPVSGVSAAVSLVERDIFEIDRIATGDADKGVPAYRVNLDYKKFYTAQRDADVAGAVDTDRRAELAKTYRTVSGAKSSVQTKHTLATEIFRTTLLTGDGNEEFVQAGGFSSATPWNWAVGWHISTVGSEHTLSGASTNGQFYQIMSTLSASLPGDVYWLQYTISDYVSGSLNVTLGVGDSTTDRSSNGTFSEYITQGSTGIGAPQLKFNPTSWVLGNIDDVSLTKSTAQTECERILELYKTRRDYLRLLTTLDAAQPDLGDFVHVTHPDLGLSGGKNLVCLGIRDRASENKTELILWG